MQNYLPDDKSAIINKKAIKSEKKSGESTITVKLNFTSTNF